MKNFFLVLTAFAFFFSASGQTALPGKYTSMNEKAIHYFENALKDYKAGNDKDALELLDEAEKKDPNFSEVYELRATIFGDHRELEKAIEQYKKLFEHNPRPHWESFLACASFELKIGRYEEAKTHIEQYLKAPYLDPDIELIARKELINCNFAIDAMKHPVDFKPVNMGPNINSKAHEYFPAISVDGKKFLFTRNFRTAGGGASQEDFYMSEKKDSVWQLAQPVSEINTPYNEGAPAFSADGKIMFFAACSEGRGDADYGPTRKGYGSCDIFYSVLVNGHWSKPQNVGPPVNTADWESQPSFSSDGKSLYFIRGHIEKDHSTHDKYIYVSHINENGEFSVPVRLNDKINTPGQKESVFIAPDNRTLYFSSDGLPGMGGLDIYFSKLKPDGDWGEPVNLGYPINTCAPENSILVDPNGKVAYFASERSGGFGGLDFYTFDLPQNARPEIITYFKGKVYDAVSKKPLEASFELIDLATQKSLYTSLSERGSGEFFLTLTSSKDYALNVSKPGYLFYSGNFSLTNATDKTKPFLVDIPLQPIDTGKVEPLKNVFFDSDKFDLRPESKAELDKLVSFLAKNKTLKIQLRGHTDDVGDKKKNLVLSQNRAKAVCDYLLAHGIEKERLLYKGFGDTLPVEKNDTPEHRQQNRRTEYKIIGK